ncbi:hypothetical protein [Phocaeicola sp.]
MLHSIIIQSMNEEKKKKPLLPYEQVVKMIDERIAQEEQDVKVDERIVRVEKAAEELEAKRKKERLGRKKKRCCLKGFLKKIFRCRKM